MLGAAAKRELDEREAKMRSKEELIGMYDRHHEKLLRRMVRMERLLDKHLPDWRKRMGGGKRWRRAS
jgi:hypothetical protein